MGRLMTNFLPSNGKSLDYLLLEPGLMPQSLYSEVSDMRPAHHESILSFTEFTLKVLLQNKTGLCQFYILQFYTTTIGISQKRREGVGGASFQEKTN